jgi:hypothetical protein
MTSTRIPTRTGMIPNLQPIVLPDDGRLNVKQLATLTDAISNLIRAVNGRLTFGENVQSAQSGNIDGQIKTLTFTTIDTDYEVRHGLGRKPLGIIVLYVDTDAAVVRASSEGSWTTTRLFVRCNSKVVTARFVVV